MTEYMFNADRGQIIDPGAVVLEEETAQLLLPLLDLLVTKEFPYKKGDFEEADPKLWNRENLLEIGKLVLAVVEQDGKRRPITTEHLGRLAILGQVPGLWEFDKFFDNFTEYKQAVGSPIRYDRLQYADWGITDFVQYAKRTMKDLGHLPDIAHYNQLFDQGRGPSFALIEDRAGGIRALHDYLGYPSTKDWDESNFVDWGVKVMTANPGKDFNLNIIKALAAERRGPTWWTIYAKCGKWSSFRKDVENEFLNRPEIRKQERAAKLNDYRLMAERGTLALNILALSKDELLKTAARYMVIQDCVADLSVDKKSELSRTSRGSLIKQLRKLRPNLTAGYIEMVAVSLNVFDDIWPMDESVKHFHVPQKRIDEIRLAKNLVQAQIRAKRKARSHA